MTKRPDSEPIEASPEREASVERQFTARFLADMFGRQQRVMNETMASVTGELSGKAGVAVESGSLFEHLKNQVTSGLPDVDPGTARRLCGLIQSKELNPRSSLWQENSGAPSMMGRIARSQRESLREIVCEVAAADIRAGADVE